MLEIADIEYRFADIEQIGLAAKDKIGKRLTDTTPVGPDGLVWGHLLDSRIRILLESPARYRFTNWDQLSRTLNASWAFEEENERTHYIPTAISGHVVLPRTAPFPIPPNTTLEALFAGVRQASGTHSDLVSIPKPDESWATAASAAAKIDRHNALQKLWGVCGAASQSLIERLYSAGAGPVETFNRVFEGAHDARLLEALLKLPVRETVFIHIAEPAIHEFTIEKRPDGQAYLHQGYLSAYSAMWWAGIKGADVPPFFTLTGKPAELMREHREMFGLGQPIMMETFAWMMYSYLLSDTHGENSGNAWKKLPFNPGIAEEDERWKGRSIVLQVKGFQLADEAGARKALADKGRNLPLTTLIMAESGRLLAK